ncbi:S100P-binding protein [Myripristis murdjan]|uniref:S100P-binding protein n=1 Tax=Myripristis murdjan TaxID=586833 RepID=A0A668ABP6_9TELE|nr:S100P-binding protein [Myripristis murdjan]
MDQKHVTKHVDAGQGMDKSNKPMKMIFNKPGLVKSEASDHKINFEHLKPLSVYSRMITCDSKTIVPDSTFSNPFVNLKIEVINVSSRKRKSDDHTYCTPTKKPYSPQAVSTDLGCLKDLCTPPKQGQDSTPAISKSVLLDGPKAIRSQNKEAVKSQLDLEHVTSGPSVGSGGEERMTAQQNFKSTPKTSAPLFEDAPLNLNHAFDFDIESILCLSPIGTRRSGGFTNSVGEDRECPSSSTFQNEPVSIQSPAPGITEAGGDEKKEGRGKELKRGEDMNTKEEEGDSGYFSLSYRQALKAGRNPSEPGSPLLPQVTSCSLVWRNREVLEGEGDIPGPAEPEFNKQGVACHEYISLTTDDLSSITNGSLLASVGGATERLEDDVEEASALGAPILESSVCNSSGTVQPTGGTVKRRVEKKEAKEEVTKSIHEFQDKTLAGKGLEGRGTKSVLKCQDSGAKTSLKSTTSTVQQVKSVVVLGKAQTKSAGPSQMSKPSSVARTILKIGKGNRTGMCPRPLVFAQEEDWQHEKQMYVNSVIRHMQEDTGTGQDGMTEVLNLMRHVTEQEAGPNGTQWQHPSDFTRRNYQRRFGNLIPTIPLAEWHTQNSKSYRRFVSVPKIFQRSPVP